MAVVVIAACGGEASGSGQPPAAPPPTSTSAAASLSVPQTSSATASTNATPAASSTPTVPTTAESVTPTTTLGVAGTAQLVDSPAGADRALAALATLPVKGRAPMTDYARESFGVAWTDDVPGVDGGHNGCDTRDDILRRDLTDATIAVDGCKVVSGVLHDPYTGTDVEYTDGSPDWVQIDHVVALADAWVTGIQYKSVLARVQLANDPLNLQATAASANTQKSDGDAATWLPSNKSYRCTYVARQVDVKARYGLWVTAAERDAITSVLQGCGGTPVAATSAPPPSASTSTPSPAAPTTSTRAGGATSTQVPAVKTSTTPPRTTSQAPHTITTHAAPPTSAAPPPRSTAAAPEPSGCYPLTNAGNCYKPGQKCRSGDHGAMGIDADGHRIQCQDVNGWRWERV